MTDEQRRLLEEFHATDIPTWLDANGFTTAIYVESGEEWADVTARFRAAYAAEQATSPRRKAVHERLHLEAMVRRAKR